MLQIALSLAYFAITVIITISFVNQKPTTQYARIEKVLLIILAIDSVIKLFLSYQQKETSNYHFKMEDIDKNTGNIQYSIIQLMNQRKGFGRIPSSTLYLDVALTIIVFALYLIQLSQDFQTTTLAVLVMTRGYLKLPICYCILSFITDMFCNEKKKTQLNTIYPKMDKLEFNTYKEKVLFVLNKLITLFGKSPVLVDPNNDLIWCAFVIENDYL